jgi:hypothetical protein
MVIFCAIIKGPSAGQAWRKMNIDDSYKKTFTDCFNQGFRRGANDRAAAGIEYGGAVQRSLAATPAPPPAPSGWHADQSNAWDSGYGMGYKLGASDAELASVEVPGACGMISGLGEEILEMMGLFNSEDSVQP